MKVKNVVLEYIWLDGHETPNLRSKIKVLPEVDKSADLKEWVPIWTFDGSSTDQANGADSECVLHPCMVYQLNPLHFFVLCEVLNFDGTPHKTNARALLRERILAHKADEAEWWWGFEQEYFVTHHGHPLGFSPDTASPQAQGRYYCSVGGDHAKGRFIAERHLIKCLGMNLNLQGINAEVAPGQWEFQCFADTTIAACDNLWMSRYLLYKLSEEENCGIDMEPKPVSGDWNGSGCHCNFSTREMRNEGGKQRFEKLFASLEERHTLHIAGYGKNNHLRLTGNHETQHIDTFSWGVGDRGASIRVPIFTEAAEWRGHVEDRRPASNCDPYVVTRLLIEAYNF